MSRVPQDAGRLWRRNGLVWAALLALLVLTYVAAYVPLGALNLPISIAIAVMKAGLVAALFMELDRSSALIRLTSAIAVPLLIALFVLTATDVVTRLWEG